MTTLYEWPPVRSQRAKWVLEELGSDYSSRKVNLLEGEQDGEAYRAIHPLGVLPALRTERYTMYESVAIVMQLIDERPGCGLAPDPGSAERAHYYQWCVFAAAEIDPALMVFFDNSMRPLEGMRPPGRQHNATFADYGRQEFAARAEAVSNALAGREHLLESGFSGADIAVGHSCFMAAHMGLLADFPVLNAYFERLQQRPAYQRAYAM